MSRISVPVLDEWIEAGHKVAVGEGDEGFVRLVDYMGNDDAIVQAARVSYGAGTKKVREDRGLIRYLMRKQHSTPFEQCEIKFHVRVPMDIWRQFVRHRTAHLNEYSTRYSVAIDATSKTDPNKWRSQSKKNKQGSGEYLDGGSGYYLSGREEELQKYAREVYEERLKYGVAREQARKDLPLSTYTEAYWKIDLHNLFHFLALRLDSHAQKEIREYAEAMAFYVKQWVPVAWEAFEDYRLGGVYFSDAEMELLSDILSHFSDNSFSEIVGSFSEGAKKDEELSDREVREFKDKLRKRGLVV